MLRTKLFGAAVGLMGLMTVGVAVGHAADKASLRLNWVLIGQHPAYYLGLERGFYADEDIDLTINEGRGSGPAVQLVAGGEDTFGLADTGAVIAVGQRARRFPLSCHFSAHPIWASPAGPMPVSKR